MFIFLLYNYNLDDYVSSAPSVRSLFSQTFASIFSSTVLSRIYFHRSLRNFISNETKIDPEQNTQHFDQNKPTQKREKESHTL